LVTYGILVTLAKRWCAGWRERQLRRLLREWLEAVANGEVVLTHQQFNACKILIEYGEPKLGRIGAMPDAETFAVQLEKAIERSGLNRVIDITPTKEP
jgi:hypothetical protein